MILLQKYSVLYIQTKRGPGWQSVVTHGAKHPPRPNPSRHNIAAGSRERCTLGVTRYTLHVTRYTRRVSGVTCHALSIHRPLNHNARCEVSTHYLHTIYTVSTQYLHSIYTISTYHVLSTTLYYCTINYLP